MARKPKAESWEYLTRELTAKTSKPYIALVNWLELNRPLFWLKDAQRLAEYVVNRRFKPITAKDIPDTVQPELVSGLVDQLQQLNNYYEYLRRKSEEFRKRLESAKRAIPPDELKALQDLADFVYFGSVAPENEQYNIMRTLARLDTFEKINIWLAKKPHSRAHWISEAQRLKENLVILNNIRQRLFEKEQKERERRWQERWQKSQREYEEKIRKLRFNFVDTHLQILGLTAPATVTDIKRAFRKLAKAHHPDAGGCENKFKELVNAYDEALKYI